MSGRQRNGQFAKGNSGGPGRPPLAIEKDYLTTLSDAVSADDWRAVVTRAVEDAKTGDPRARDWLAKYLIGDRHVHTVDVLHQRARLVEDSDWYGTADLIEERTAERAAIAALTQANGQEGPSIGKKDIPASSQGR